MAPPGPPAPVAPASVPPIAPAPGPASPPLPPTASASLPPLVPPDPPAPGASFVDAPPQATTADSNKQQTPNPTTLTPRFMSLRLSRNSLPVCFFAVRNSDRRRSRRAPQS